MTAAQSLQIYEVLGKHFGNTEDAKIVVTEIEQIIEKKLTEKSDVFASKKDLAETKVDLIKWMVGFWMTQMAAIIGLYLTHR